MDGETRALLGSPSRKSSAIKWSNIVLATLGVVLGLTGCFAGLHYRNAHFGAWGIISGAFAGVTLHLAILHKTGLINSWYSPGILSGIIKLGLAGSVAGLAGAITYFTIAILEHHGSSLSTSFFFSGAETVLTFIFSLYLIILARRIKVKMERDYASQLEGVRAYPEYE